MKIELKRGNKTHSMNKIWSEIWQFLGNLWFRTKGPHFGKQTQCPFSKTRKKKRLPIPTTPCSPRITSKSWSGEGLKIFLPTPKNNRNLVGEMSWKVESRIPSWFHCNLFPKIATSRVGSGLPRNFPPHFNLNPKIPQTKQISRVGTPRRHPPTFMTYSQIWQSCLWLKACRHLETNWDLSRNDQTNCLTFQ